MTTQATARIASKDDIEAGLAKLVVADPRLLPVRDLAGEVPLRRSESGFEGLAAIIVAQQISRSAADAIWRRFVAAFSPVEPAALLAADDETLRSCGLSRPKVRTLRAVATACQQGLDLRLLQALQPDEAIAKMVEIKGVGPWTAEVYLLFCCGHVDIFPAGDLALQVAVQEAFGLSSRPDDKTLRQIAAAWSPWRGVAARLFWSYYRACRHGRDALPV